MLFLFTFFSPHMSDLSYHTSHHVLYLEISGLCVRACVSEHISYT
jgi:hypothetical protein